MKLEWPMFTSTSPRELLRPMKILFCRTMYSNSRPSIRAMATPLFSGLHCTLEGLAGADLRARRAHASLSWDLDCAAISLLRIWLPRRRNNPRRGGVWRRPASACCIPKQMVGEANHNKNKLFPQAAGNLFCLGLFFSHLNRSPLSQLKSVEKQFWFWARRFETTQTLLIAKWFKN